MISWLELTALLDSPIAFHRVFAEIGGGAIPGLFLSQAFYWTNRTKDPNGWFYKTQEDWHRETALIRSEQDRARRELKARGILEEEKRGLPCKLYYRVNKSALLNSISTLIQENQRNSQFVDSSKLDWGNQQTGLQNPANTTAKSSKQSIYRDYSENTSETTSPLPPEEKKHAPAFEDSGSKEPASSTLKEGEEMADSLPGESKEVHSARDNNTKRAKRVPQGDKHFGQVRQENYQRSFAAKVQHTIIPIEEMEPWGNKEVFRAFEAYLLQQAKSWNCQNPASYVANKLQGMASGKAARTEFTEWQVKQSEKAKASEPKSQEDYPQLSLEQEAWIAIMSQLEQVSEFIQVDIKTESSYGGWYVRTNISTPHGSVLGSLDSAMQKLPLSAIQAKFPEFYPECHRLAKRKFPHLSLPEPSTPQDRAS